VKQRAEEVLSELCRLVELAQSDDEADQGRDTLFQLGELLIRSVDIVNRVGLWWRSADQQPVKIKGFDLEFGSALELILCLGWQAWGCARLAFVGENDDLTWQAMSVALADDESANTRWRVFRRRIRLAVPSRLKKTNLVAKLDIEHRNLRSGPHLLDLKPKSPLAGPELVRVIQTDVAQELRPHFQGRTAAVRRDAKAEARNRWLYNKASQKNPPPWKALMAALNKIAPKRGWRKLGSPQAVKQAVAGYIRQKSLAPLPPRKEG
jgi:hypothetical protein